MKIHSLHKHIDNGGISIEVHQTDDRYKNLYIVMETQYHGYPSVRAELHTWSNIDDAEFLKELGTMLIEAASKIQR